MVISFLTAIEKESVAAYSIATISLCIFSAIYCVGFLGLEIGGNHLALKAAVSSLGIVHTELKDLLTSLIKVSFILSSKETPIGGPSKTQLEMVEECLAPFADKIEKIDRQLIDAEIKIKSAAREV